MNKPILGFAGLGNMGGPMARRLAQSGHELVVYDRQPAAIEALAGLPGIRGVGSLAELGANADIVFTSLPTPQILKAAVLGDDGIASGGRVKIITDFSTIGPQAAMDLDAGLRKQGLGWVEAPVSGGVKGAEAGTLAIMVSCADVLLETVQPLLQACGRVFHTGSQPGQAQTAKLANNLLSAAAMVISSEAMVMGVKAGIEPGVLLDIINAGSGRNSATADKIPRAVLSRRFDYGFATGLSYKDTRLCIDEAEAMGVPMVLGAMVRQMLAVTQAKFGPASDFTSVARIYEEWAGVEIDGRPKEA